MKKKERYKWLIALFVTCVLVLVVTIIVVNKKDSKEVSAADAKFDAVKLRPISKRDHFLGSIESPVQVIIFSDPECVYCKNLELNVLPKLRAYYKEKIVVAYRHHLLSRDTRAPLEAEAMECAGIIGGEEKFWDYLHRLYSVTPAENNLDPEEIYSIADFISLPQKAFAQCMDTHKGKNRVDEDRQEALLNDISTAPTIVVRSGSGPPVFLPGSYAGPIRAAINSLLAQQK